MTKAFECRVCGECCYGEGGIPVGEDEADAIARFLGVTREDFFARYTEARHGRIYLATGPDRFCIFYDQKEHCIIHPVKPERCRLWPFFPAIVGDEENWEAAKDACPGISRTCSFEDFVRQSKE